MGVVGITAGAFDLCHAGHLLFFAECKKRSNYLVSCLQTNPQFDRPEKNKPAETTFERWARLDACKYIDQIIPYDTERDLMNILKNVDWNSRFLDHTYEGTEYTGNDFRQADHVFIKRNHDYSTTNLRNKICG